MAITIPPISALPLPPTKADPNNFAARADDFLGALPEFQVELNTTVTQMNKLVTGLDQGSPIAAWVVGTTYNFPTVVAGSDGYSYRCIDTGVVGVDPVTDNGTNWVRIAEPPLGIPTSDGMVLTSTVAGVRAWASSPPSPKRAKFAKTGTNTISISPGRYELSDTVFPYWTSTLTYNVTTVTASTWSYIYINAASISGSGRVILTTGNLLNSTTAPVYDETKFGWYDGNNLCIFAVRGNTAGTDILDFVHQGGKDVFFYGWISIQSRTTSDVNVDLTAIAPVFASAGHMIFRCSDEGVGEGWWAPYESSGYTGHQVVKNYDDLQDISDNNHNSVVVPLNRSRFKANVQRTEIYTSGWIF